MQGSCLCGRVQYEIVEPVKIFQYCHCSRCRKVTGSAHASNLFISPSQFSWLKGENQVGRFEHPDAKYYASQFCKNCGSSLPWPVKGGSNIVVPAGTLDDDPGIRPKQHLFWGSRACWYDGAETLDKIEAFPVKK